MRGVDNILSESWATYEFKGLDFGGARLNARFKQAAESISKQPTTSLSTSAGNWSQAKGTYRMFDSAKVTADAILMSHQNTLAERLDGDPIVFAVQDTSFLNFTDHTQTTGLGRIGQRKAGDQLPMGLIVHSTLALTPDGVPLGLLDQQVFARSLEKQPKLSNQLPIEEEESIRWI